MIYHVLQVLCIGNEASSLDSGLMSPKFTETAFFSTFLDFSWKSSKDCFERFFEKIGLRTAICFYSNRTRQGGFERRWSVVCVLIELGAQKVCKILFFTHVVFIHTFS